MNIACIACPARYAISAEKIVGRKVRIGCKRCGTKLIIDGTTEPPSVRADTGVSSMPPPVRYHLAISHDQRERGDLKRVVELYGRGAILANTLAWREGMPQWLPLFEVDEIKKALNEAGYSPQQAGSPGYAEDEAETRVGGGYAEDDEVETQVSKSPLEDSKPPPPETPLPRFDDDEDDDAATSVFDSEALQRSAGAAWSEPASWRPGRQNPLGTGEWRERGQSPLPPRSSSKPPGAWAERGLEDDELTHMVAPLSEQPQSSRRPPLSSGPGLEQRRPKSLQPAVPLSSRQVRPAKASAAPPSLPPEERMTGQRSDDSVLFTLDRLTKQKPASAPASERAAIDFSDVPKLSLGPSVPASVASRDLALLAPAPAKPKVPPPAPAPPRAPPPAPQPAPRPPSWDDTIPPAPRRGSKKWLLVAALLVIGGVLGGLYATGRWPLVVKTAMSVWQRVQGAR